MSSRVHSGMTLALLLRAHDVAVRMPPPSSVRRRRCSICGRCAPISLSPRNDQRRERPGLRYEIDGDRFLRVGRSPGETLVARVLPIPKTRSVEVVSGRIHREHTSLVAALDAAGETIDLTLALAESSAATSTSPPKCSPAITSSSPSRSSSATTISSPATVRLLAAEFINAGRRVRAVRFTPDGGSPGYYDERGRSMSRFFLASPLKFQPVVTSGFSKRGCIRCCAKCARISASTIARRRRAGRRRRRRRRRLRRR